MKLFRLLPFLALAGYSGVLLGKELLGTQADVQPYFANLSEPVRLFGMNTTLSMVLLVSAALFFAVRAHLLALADPRAYRERLFSMSQVVVFLYLGLDDRFGLHEAIANAYCLNDAWIQAGLALVEIGCLFGLGRIHAAPRRIQIDLLLAMAAFGVMFVTDAFVPTGWPGRLSVEDLAKVWSGAFFCLFAWDSLGLDLARFAGSKKAE